MALIKVEMSMPPVDGMDIKFKAPCDCTQITGLLVEYPEGSKEFTFRDCHGNNLAGIGNLFGAGAYIKVIVDVGKGYAYLQNADNNGFLNSAVFGTYTHNGETLTGSGVNGKFKATTSGTISTITVNGAACSIRCGEETSIDLIAGNWYTFILDGDTVNFSSGGAGGGGLNFRVIGNPPPASPKVNDIWIDTDVPITGYELSPAEPANMTEGMVWITIGTSSTVAFNALKKNGIQVYPIYAKQYVSGALVDKTAKSWQGGEWVDWIRYLFNNGDQCTELTGGWSDSGFSHSSAILGAGSVTNGKIVLKGSLKLIGIQNPVNLSGYSKLKVIGKMVSVGTNGFSICLSTKKENFNQSPIAYLRHDNLGEFDIELPFEPTDTNAYVAIYTQGYDENNAEITEVMLA